MPGPSRPRPTSPRVVLKEAPSGGLTLLVWGNKLKEPDGARESFIRWAVPSMVTYTHGPVQDLSFRNQGSVS